MHRSLGVSFDPTRARLAGPFPRRKATRVHERAPRSAALPIWRRACAASYNRHCLGAFDPTSGTIAIFGRVACGHTTALRGPLPRRFRSRQLPR
jgi:hypothetical protein